MSEQNDGLHNQRERDLLYAPNVIIINHFIILNNKILWISAVYLHNLNTS